MSGTIVVSSTDELKTALLEATSGTQILLEPGEYDGLFLKDLSYDDTVTIRSLDPEDPAVFTEPVQFVRATNLVLDNIAFQSEGIDTGSTLQSPLLFLHSCQNVTMTDLTFVGYIPTEEEGVDPYAAETARNDVIAGFGYETGLRIHNSDDITLEDATFRDLRYAIYAGEGTNLTLTGMSIEDVREGVLFYEIQGMTISDSVFQNFKPWIGMDDASYDTTIHDHPDMIQFWGDNSTLGVHDITITGNTFIAEEGSSTQTIFGHLDTAQSESVTATNFVITDNLIINGQTHGISIGDVDGMVISDNVLLPNSETTDSGRVPTIRLPGSTNVLVENNTLLETYGITNVSPDALVAAGITVTSSTLLSIDPTADNFWGLWVPDSSYALAQQAKENGSGTVRGTAAAETLWASSQGSFLEGLGGNDVLAGRAGTDIMSGGSGADRFLYDMRKSTGQADDLILDLDFSEGDNIYVLTNQTGLFRDDIDTDNSLRTLNNGSAAIIDSYDDLWELITAGTMTYESDGLGGGIISLADGSGYRLHLAGIETTELLYAAEFGSETAITGTNAADVLDGGATAPLAAQDEGSAAAQSTVGLFINGLGGNDTLKGQSGADILTGGEGGDLFHYDLRGAPNQADDLITDLNFSEGDAIFIQAEDAGLFNDSTDPDNTLEILNGGTAAIIDSLDDIWELVASGAWRFTSDGLESGILSTTSGSGHALHLLGVSPSELANYEEISTRTVVTGTDDAETLWGNSSDTFLNGLAGDDTLVGRDGADIMMGGQGADRFLFDLRTSSGADDLIMDLDFSEGDEIFILTNDAGLFSDAPDPENALRILGAGQNAILDSLADLSEIVASGAMALVSDDEDGSVLKRTDGSGHGLRIVGVDAIDLVFGAQIAAMEATTGTAKDDTLWASSGGSYLEGLEGDDYLAGRGGADIFEGGAGADRFLFDLRNLSGADDLILDLDFSEGDEIYIVTETPGLFKDAADLDNSLSIGSDGSSVILTSRDDLQNLIDTGAMHYGSDGMGGGYLALADDSGFRLQLFGIDAFEFSIL